MENGAVLRYRVYYPGGNTTALAEAPKQGNGLASIAKHLMNNDPAIEQVGFLYPSQNFAFKLQMMGGEFCVNASRCAAYQWFAENSGDEVVFEVSGLDRPLKARLEHDEIFLHIPSDIIVSINEVPEGHVVVMEGIKFLVSSDEVDASSMVEKYHTDYPAIGVITVNDQDEMLSIKANVWVRETGTFVCETGCGSGSIAAFLARKGPGVIGWVQQPSGYEYAVDARDNCEIILSGVIEEQGEREVSLELDYAEV